MERTRWTSPLMALLCAVLGLGAAGCPEPEGDDDDTTAAEPEGCESFSLNNIQYEFTVEDPEDLLGLGEPLTDDQWWMDYAETFASTDTPVLMLAWGLTVGGHEPDGNGHMITLEFLDPKLGLPLLTVNFWYFLPQGKTIPVAAGDNVQWVYVWNFVSEPATAPLILAEDGSLLFYGEPGANGLTFSNDPLFPDQTTNPVFSDVIPRDHGCSPQIALDCGNQYNLETEFVTTTGESMRLWPGETGSFQLGEAGAEVDFEITNVWSYDWSDVVCDGPQYERNFAFFVLAV
jgi:hypothetical protein